MANGSRDRATADEVHHEGNDRQHQEHVDPRAELRRGRDPENPEKQQENGQRPQHEAPPVGNVRARSRGERERALVRARVALTDSREEPADDVADADGQTEHEDGVLAHA